MALPRRVYLDSGTLQTMYADGETLVEDEPSVIRRPPALRASSGWAAGIRSRAT